MYLNQPLEEKSDSSYHQIGGIYGPSYVQEAEFNFGGR